MRPSESEDRLPVITHEQTMEMDTCVCGNAEDDNLIMSEEEDEEDLDGEDGDQETREAENDFIIRNKSTLTSCLRSRPCSVCLYLVVVLFLLSSTVAIVVLGILVIAPYHKASGFREAMCTASSVMYEASHKRCSCGHGCNSKFPCIVILVEVKEAIENVNRTHISRLYEDESVLHKQCSYYPKCLTSYVDNNIKVQRYLQTYGSPSQDFGCLYNPGNMAEVIRKRRFQPYHLAHGLTWSLLVLIASVTGLVWIAKNRGCNLL